MEFLTISQTAALLHWTQTEVLAALRKGVLAGVQVPGKQTKWAVVHPGVLFVEYVRNPASRLPHIAILSLKDVAAICGRNEKVIRWHIKRGHITPIVFPGKRQGNAKNLFTPWQVRDLIMRILSKDPYVRPPILHEVMTEFFKRSMIAKVPADPFARMNEEIRWICETPEPERSQRLAELIRMAEEINKQQQEALTAEAGPLTQEPQNAASADGA